MEFRPHHTSTRNGPTVAAGNHNTKFACIFLGNSPPTSLPISPMRYLAVYIYRNNNGRDMRSQQFTTLLDVQCILPKSDMHNRELDCKTCRRLSCHQLDRHDMVHSSSYWEPLLRDQCRGTSKHARKPASAPSLHRIPPEDQTRPNPSQFTAYTTRRP